MEQITTLKENQIFVFGSNANGNHAGGAARQAVESFGAIMGQAEGLQGQSYGIVTLDKDMNKVSLEYIKSQLQTLNEHASQNTDKEYLLTLIGCGIAGFSIEEISAVVGEIDWVDNVIIPQEFIARSYKAFGADMKCRDFQYKEGERYTIDGDVAACERGFHACENPFDVLNYYPLVDPDGNMSRFAKVEQSGKIISREDKRCSSRIRIKAELGFGDFIKACVEWVKEKTSPSDIKVDDNVNSGDYAQIGSSGDYAQIGSSGDYAKIGSSGDGAKIGSSGNGAQIGSSGYYAQIKSTGKDSVICCAGWNSVASAKIGSWITLSEWKNGKPVCVKTEYVDGERIKEDVLYILVDGEFKEV